ncbi:hypothetical protein HDU67_001538 [Dinochytrium kinnereticum]|nr:hypothetical protein HDU67_001538 [Dinochytrium kinnereticum]
MSLTDEHLREVFMESQVKLQNISKQLSSVRAQIAGKQREQRISELSAKELKALPPSTPAYKAVGRMFIKQELSQLSQALVNKSKDSEKEAKMLTQAATKLERDANETEKKLKDVLNMRIAMDRAASGQS